MSTSLGKDLGRSQGTDFYGIDDSAHRRRTRRPRPGTDIRRRAPDPGGAGVLGACRVPPRTGLALRRARRGGRLALRLRLPRHERAGRGPDHPRAGPRRRKLQHLQLRAQRPGDDRDRPARLRRAEATLAARPRLLHQARRVRADRARPRLRRRPARHQRAPRRRALGPRRRQTLDRPGHPRRRRRRLGSRRGRRTSGPSSSTTAATTRTNPPPATTPRSSPANPATAASGRPTSTSTTCASHSTTDSPARVRSPTPTGC